jgi:hypothetical protein
MRLESAQVIGRPPEEAFGFLADARDEVRRNEWARRVEQLSDGPVGRGARFHGSFKNSGELEFDLAEYERPRRVQQYNRTGSGELRRTHALEPVPGGPRVWQQGLFAPRG